MQLITAKLSPPDRPGSPIFLKVERATLAKRRWRGTAEDGAEFGFDLAHALADGDVFHIAPEGTFTIAQLPEPVLETALGASATDGARLGWLVGNLHFPIAIEAGIVRLVDDPAIRQLLDREHIAFTACERVFRPLRGGHSHSHDA